MRRLFILLFICLVGCSRNYENIKVENLNSNLYTNEQLEKAVKLVKDEFSKMPELTLERIEYAGDREQGITLLTDFKTNAFSDKHGLNTNDNYTNFKYVIDVNQMKIVDRGY